MGEPKYAEESERTHRYAPSSTSMVCGELPPSSSVFRANMDDLRIIDERSAVRTDILPH